MAGPGVFTEGQVITVFRSRHRPESEAEYLRMSEEMQAAARAVPGLVDFKTFAAPDGEQVSLVTFASAEPHRAWRDDPRHRGAQRQARDDCYLEYSAQVGTCTHVSTWERHLG